MTTTSATKHSATTSNHETASKDSFETVTVKVEGMSCTACQVPVRDALAHTPGVSDADVSYQRGDAKVKYDPRQTSVDQIKRARLGRTFATLCPKRLTMRGMHSSLLLRTISICAMIEGFQTTTSATGSL